MVNKDVYIKKHQAETKVYDDDDDDDDCDDEVIKETN